MTIKPSSPDNNEDTPMEFPMPETPLHRHDSNPPTYMEWMNETAERTRVWFSLPIESRPPRRQPVPERFVM